MKSVVTVALLALVTGCVTRHRVVIKGKDLLRGVPALEKSGRAVVTVEDIEDDDNGGLRFLDEIAIDQPIGSGDERKPVRDWIVDCGSVATTKPCMLSPALADIPIEVRRLETTSVKPVIGGVVVATVASTLVAAVVCGLACAEGSDARTASKYTLIGEGVLVGAGLVWGLITCFGGRTCRD